MSKTIIRYKTLPENKTPHGHKYRKGVWYKVDSISICHKGFHCSKNLVDAMGYVTPGWVAKVEVRGESEVQSDKEVWSEIKIVEWVKWTKKDSVALAIHSAEKVLKNYEKKYPKDLRPREAIEAAKKVLKNNTAANRSAAWSAAWSAESAWSAAESAARSAWSAQSAARSAAWSSAESAALSAAWSAALDNTEREIHNWIIRRIFK